MTSKEIMWLYFPQLLFNPKISNLAGFGHKISIEEISIGVLPLLIPYVLMVLILVFFSEWVTYLPDLVYGPTRWAAFH